MPHWRPMQAQDLPAVMAVANIIHPDLPEDEAVFAERRALFPQGSWVVEKAGEIMGYAVSHPIPPETPPALNARLHAIPPEATDYYIHDVALLPSLRGSGLARQGVETLLQVARDYDTCALVSVYGTRDFWGRFGFVPSPKDMTEKLQPYGEGAVFMQRPSTL